MTKHYTLFPYQARAFEWIKAKPKCALHLKMSAGKTLTSLHAINVLKPKRTLIVAPRTVVISWVEEIGRWDAFKNIKYIVISAQDKPKKRLEIAKSDAEMFLVNYDLLEWLWKNGFNNHYDCIILDESTYVKNYAGKRIKLLAGYVAKGSVKDDTERLKYVNNHFNYKRMIQLTGTALANGYHDIWGQIYCLDKGERLGANISEFRRRYFIKQDMYNYIVTETGKEAIREAIKDIVFVMTKEEEMQLPERIFDYTAIDFLDPAILQQYKKFKREKILEIGEDKLIEARTAAVLVMKLLQFCNGAVYNEDKSYTVVHNYKIEALADLVEKYPDENLIVMYTFKSDLARLQKAFPNAVVYQGDTQKKLWDAGKIKMLLSHPTTFSRGLNMQKSGRIIIWFGLTYDYEAYVQTNARVHRIGQEKTVIIQHLIMHNTIEKKVLEVLNNKELTQAEYLRELMKEVKQ